MRTPSRYIYKKVGLMTYLASERDGAPLGHVWRTRTGWSAKRLDNTQTVEDYPGSRDVATSTLKEKD